MAGVFPGKTPSAANAHDHVLRSRPSKPAGLERWEFPGWGEYQELGADSPVGQNRQPFGRKLPAQKSFIDEEGKEEKIGQWGATAISGNDITSSCLYASGLCAYEAGVYAPLALFLVGVMLFFFRYVYGEVCTALPLNGGAYNALLNTTSKGTASIAACLTILSYVATAVVSASEACNYMDEVWDIPVMVATVLLLFTFAVLTLMGITESARVVGAFVIFSIHIFTLFVILFFSTYHFIHGGDGFSLFRKNSHHYTQKPPTESILYGFATAALGISGFETSANYIEEQKEGVFIKTLRNMWVAVCFFNPLLSMYSLTLLPMHRIRKNKNVLLSELALKVGGRWLQVWLCLDAFLVLAGAVLTAYVGVTGLMKRLALDRCVPSFLLIRNRFRGTNHFIIFIFFFICSSLYLIVDGKVGTLGSVYSISFLSVMSLFAIGDMLLKYKRKEIPRSVKAPWIFLILAFVLVVTCLVSDVVRSLDMLKYFALYFSVTGTIFSVTFYRISLLKILLRMTRHCLRQGNTLVQTIRSRSASTRTPQTRPLSPARFSPLLRDGTPSPFEGKEEEAWKLDVPRQSVQEGRRHSATSEDGDQDCIMSMIEQINSWSVVFFAKFPILSVMNKAILYIRQNEHSSWVRIVHVCSPDAVVPAQFPFYVRLLDMMYPKMRIDLVVIRDCFGRSVVDRISTEYGIPRSMQFITCPSQNFRHRIAELGGVRVITHWDPTTDNTLDEGILPSLTMKT